MAGAAFFDVNGTVTSRNLLLAMIGPLRRAGLLDLARLFQAYGGQVGYIVGAGSGPGEEKAESIVGSVVRGWSVDALASAAAEALPAVDSRLQAPELLDEHRRAGRLVFLVSSMPAAIVEVIGAHLGVDGTAGTVLASADGRYTGEVTFFCRGEGKAVAARRLADSHGVLLADSYAYCDGISDVPLLETVGHPVCVRPDRLLRKVADERGWPVVDGDPDHGQLPAGAVAAAAGAAVAAGALWLHRRRSSP